MTIHKHCGKFIINVEVLEPCSMLGLPLTSVLLLAFKDMEIITQGDAEIKVVAGEMFHSGLFVCVRKSGITNVREPTCWSRTKLNLTPMNEWLWPVFQGTWVVTMTLLTLAPKKHRFSLIPPNLG